MSQKLSRSRYLDVCIRNTPKQKTKWRMNSVDAKPNFDYMFLENHFLNSSVVQWLLIRVKLAIVVDNFPYFWQRLFWIEFNVLNVNDLFCFDILRLFTVIILNHHSTVWTVCQKSSRCIVLFWQPVSLVKRHNKPVSWLFKKYSMNDKKKIGW